jgi:hypothetical protein
MNKMGFYLVDDPREKALRDALYHAISRLRYAKQLVRRQPMPDSVSAMRL